MITIFASYCSPCLTGFQGISYRCFICSASWRQSTPYSKQGRYSFPLLLNYRTRTFRLQPVAPLSPFTYSQRDSYSFFWKLLCMFGSSTSSSLFLRPEGFCLPPYSNKSYYPIARLISLGSCPCTDSCNWSELAPYCQHYNNLFSGSTSWRLSPTTVDASLSLLLLHTLMSPSTWVRPHSV